MMLYIHCTKLFPKNISGTCAMYFDYVNKPAFPHFASPLPQGTANTWIQLVNTAHYSVSFKWRAETINVS